MDQGGTAEVGEAPHRVACADNGDECFQGKVVSSLGDRLVPQVTEGGRLHQVQGCRTEDVAGCGQGNGNVWRPHVQRMEDCLRCNEDAVGEEDSDGTQGGDGAGGASNSMDNQ